MFKPCPNCGFLVALIAGREASQRCPRCGSAMLEDGELPPVDEVARKPAPSRRAGSPQGDAAIGPGAYPKGARTGMPDVDAPEAGAIEASAGQAQDDAETPQRQPVRGGAKAAEIAPPSTDHEVPQPVATDAAGPRAEPAPADPAPSFAARHARTSRRQGRRWPWAVALPLLALLLALQLLLSQRVELAQDARWRPLVAATCGVIGCDVPAWREPHAFAMLARNVRPHPARDGVLHVTTSLRNDARWPQPLPVVVLSLSDPDGRVLAARAVDPADYGRRPEALVDPGDSVDIAFDVREPSPRVVSFDFELR